nr:retrovirus-related Pol polyprotein from transposon TNT 1-94 [Tanacetum cinerariifolium]
MVDGDSNDAFVYCIENTVDDRIMDSGASFHATYCKEELERFKLCSGKIRLADDKTLDIASVEDVVLKTYFGTSWSLKNVRLRRPIVEGYKGSLVVAHRNQCESLYMVEDWYEHVSLQSRRSRCTEESTGIRAEALEMVWADSISTAYLIYHIPYVLIGLHILEEEWRGKNTSPTHLKSLDGSSDTSEGSKNNGSFEDCERSDKEDSKDGASSEEEGSKTPQVRTSNRESRALISKESVQRKKAIIEEMVLLEKNQTCSLVRISARKKALQRLWMFNVKEEQNGRKRYKARLLHEPSYMRALNDTSTQHKSKGFQLAGQKENLEYRLKEVMYGLIQVSRLRYTKSLIHLAKNLKVCCWAKLVRILISKGSLSLLKILGTKSLIEMFTRLVMKEKLKFCAASTGLRVN